MMKANMLGVLKKVDQQYEFGNPFFYSYSIIIEILIGCAHLLNYYILLLYTVAQTESLFIEISMIVLFVKMGVVSVLLNFSCQVLRPAKKCLIFSCQVCDLEKPGTNTPLFYWSSHFYLQTLYEVVVVCCCC